VPGLSLIAAAVIALSAILSDADLDLVILTFD